MSLAESYAACAAALVEAEAEIAALRAALKTQHFRISDHLDPTFYPACSVCALLAAEPGHAEEDVVLAPARAYDSHELTEAEAARIGELEQLLNSEDETPVEILPDGTVRPIAAEPGA